MYSKSFSFIVEPEYDGIAAKSYLRRVLGLSARSLTLLKYSDGSVTRNGELLRSRDKLISGDTLEIIFPEDTNDIEPVDGELDILYEDEYLLAVNKPPFMPVHPTKIHQLDTLANIVSHYQQTRGERYAFRALNRIDKDTSGCVLIAKDKLSYAQLLPTVNKVYIAVCEGIISGDGVIDAPIALSPDSGIKRCADPSGQRAVTHYHPIANGNGHTLLRLRLETGRTHQIRCHMSCIGHPLAGDDLYGGSRELIDRQALHCASARFRVPFTDRYVTVDAGVPDEFLRIVDES